MCDKDRQKGETLYQIAAGQSGYFTTNQAHQAGYSDQLLGYHHREGRFQRTLRGVYRLVHFPPSDHEDLIAYWLWSGQEGVFSHETALALHQLSDAMPSNIHITLPTSWKDRRMRYPHNLIPSFSSVSEEERIWIGPLPATSPLRTIEDCQAAYLEPDLVDQAISEALERGLFPIEALKT